MPFNNHAPSYPSKAVIPTSSDVCNPIDSRSTVPPTPKDLEESPIYQPRELRTPCGSDSYKETEKTITENTAVYVEFDKDDPRDPFNFSRRKKWLITLHCCYATSIASSLASGYNMGFPSMTRELGVTDFQATIGLSVFTFGFGVVPLVSASFSEEFGRQPLYITSTIGVLLSYVTIAVSKNLQTVIVARFFQGAFGSTWATMVGGTVADLWRPHERGLPMAVYSLAALGGTGFGAVVGGWVEMNEKLQWRWIQWIQMVICAVYAISFPFVMSETRSAVLLVKIAQKMRKETGDNRHRARVEDERPPLTTLIYISCTRPLYLLFTEPIVTSFSLWIGFAWGVLYGLIESITGVYQELHGFNIGQVGTVFLTFMIGSGIGFLTNFYQERLYQKNFATRGQEARLYMACVAAIFLPASLFLYAWTSYSHIHWMAQTIGITLFCWATFVIYMGVFIYLADCYGPFASSALAGQSLCRNLVATAFPLFIQQMFKALNYRIATTVFACIALVMIPIPYALFFYGPSIRMRSKLSRMVLENSK